MSDPEPRKRVSGLKIFGIIAGLLAGLAVVAVFWMKAVADRRRDDMARDIAAEVAKVRALPGGRAVLSGTAQPGNAWDDYDQALAECQKTAVGMRLDVILDPKGEDKPGGALAQLPQFLPAIARLRSGTRRAESRKNYDWEKGAMMSTPSLTACNQVASFALLHARTLAKAGKPGEALDEILDVMQFGRDVASDGPVITYMIGMAHATLALQEAKGLFEAGALDPASCGKLERALRTLSGEFPSFEDAITRESVFFGSTLVENAGSNFAASLFYMNAARQLRGWTQRCAAASRVSWAEALKVESEVLAEVEKSWNPIAKIAAPAFVRTGGKASRMGRARINLLLAAVHYRNAGEVLDLEDPFGGQLRSSSKDGALKIWSAGPDGSGGKDLLLEVPRQ